MHTLKTIAFITMLAVAGFFGGVGLAKAFIWIVTVAIPETIEFQQFIRNFTG